MCHNTYKEVRRHSCVFVLAFCLIREDLCCSLLCVPTYLIPHVLRTPVSASCLLKGVLGFVGGSAGNQQAASTQQIGTRDYFGSGQPEWTRGPFLQQRLQTLLPVLGWYVYGDPNSVISLGRKCFTTQPSPHPLFFISLGASEFFSTDAAQSSSSSSIRCVHPLLHTLANTCGSCLLQWAPPRGGR